MQSDKIQASKNNCSGAKLSIVHVYPIRRPPQYDQRCHGWMCKAWLLLQYKDFITYQAEIELNLYATEQSRVDQAHFNAHSQDRNRNRELQE